MNLQMFAWKWLNHWWVFSFVGIVKQAVKRIAEGADGCLSLNIWTCLYNTKILKNIEIIINEN